jgi:hypothetical protein
MAGNCRNLLMRADLALPPVSNTTANAVFFAQQVTNAKTIPHRPQSAADPHITPPYVFKKMY